VTPKQSTLDQWLPDPQVRTRHQRSSAADPDTLWAAARSVRLDQTRTIGHLVRWRIPGVGPAESFVDLLEDEPFIVLDAGERYSISGLCGRIWTLARDYPHLDGPQAFADWDRRGTVRVLFAHWVRPLDDGGAELVSEARVEPTDRVAALRLRALWAVVGPFDRLVSAEPLELAARAAERDA
jgi:hypothetical protein